MQPFSSLNGWVYNSDRFLGRSLMQFLSEQVWRVCVCVSKRLTNSITFTLSPSLTSFGWFKDTQQLEFSGQDASHFVICDENGPLGRWPVCPHRKVVTHLINIIGSVHRFSPVQVQSTGLMRQTLTGRPIPPVTIVRSFALNKRLLLLTAVLVHFWKEESVSIKFVLFHMVSAKCHMTRAVWVLFASVDDGCVKAPTRKVRKVC